MLIGVETSVADIDTGIVAVAGKVDPTELCQWLKKKTRNDVKIVGSDHNQVSFFIYQSRMKGTVKFLVLRTNIF